MSPRDRILARRAKFMAAAIVGIAGCSSSTSPAEPQVCLSPPYRDTGVDARDAADAAETEPMVCLTIEPDTGVDADANDADDASDATDATDTGPTPCLTPLPDGGV